MCVFQHDQKFHRPEFALQKPLPQQLAAGAAQYKVGNVIAHEIKHYLMVPFL